MLKKTRKYTMSDAALAARRRGAETTKRRYPSKGRQWATVVIPAATKALAVELRKDGEPLWRPIARAVEK